MEAFVSAAKPENEIPRSAGASSLFASPLRAADQTTIAPPVMADIDSPGLMEGFRINGGT
jgi:hypothetical protein